MTSLIFLFITMLYYPPKVLYETPQNVNEKVPSSIHQNGFSESCKKLCGQSDARWDSVVKDALLQPTPRVQGGTCQSER